MSAPCALRPPAGPGSPAALLRQAAVVLADACAAPDVGERFSLAHLAALRTAAAVFAHRGRPASTRRRLVSAWVLLESIAPEYAEWARYFAAGAPARAAVEAGARGAVTAREADDQLRAAAEFLALVGSGVPSTSARDSLLAAPLAG